MSRWFSPSKRLQLPREQPTHRSPTQSLLHYETGSPPPSARVDPKLKLQPRRPLRLWDYWKFGAIVAAKATELTTDVLSHHIWGPRRKSWGIEMTIVTSLIRGAERHSSLVDIGTIRMLMSIGGIVPLPSDALVSPVTFRVKQRMLRGILKDFDAKEDGQRELCGEWVVGLKTWQRMQAEWKAARKSDTKQPRTYNLDARAPTEYLKRKERVILYIHGGAYYLSSAAAQRIITIPLAKYTDCRVFALDYRLAPETCFPGPLHDAVSAYFRLMDELHIPPENIILAGDSAGGGLCLALLMYLRDNAYPLPSGAILMSPWVDLTMSCESWESNAPYDVVPVPTADNHMNPIALYLGEHTEEYLTHPYASPLFGDFTGLPPLLVQAGDAEVLRDEIALLAHKATLSGVKVMHELYEDAIHVFQAYPFLDASRRSFESMRDFVKTILPQCQTRSPQLLAEVAVREMDQEIGSNGMVVVGGDGVESSLLYSEVMDYALGGTNSEHSPRNHSDFDDGPSWIKSSAQDTSPSKQKETNKGDFEHIEDLESSAIPYLTITTSPEPTPHDEAAMRLAAKRPLLTPSSSHSVTSVSPTTDDPALSPRRIQSTSSLLSLLPRQHWGGEGHDTVQSLPGSPNRCFDFDFLNVGRHGRQRSRSFKSAGSFMPSPITGPVPPSPSVRKSRVPLGMKPSSRPDNSASFPKVHSMAETGAAVDFPHERPFAAIGDIKMLVKDWSRSGPANKTIMVSAGNNSQELYGHSQS